MACQAIATPDGTFFTVTALETERFYESTVSGSNNKLQFNYCTYGIIDEDAYGLVVTSSTDSTDFVVASDNISPTKAYNIDNDAGKTIGVQLTQSSKTKCDVDSTKTYSMQTNVVCDKNITAKGQAEIVSVTKNACTYVVELKHDAGCPTVDLNIDTYLGWLSDNQWAIGLIYLVIGPVVALFGLAWFPYVVAGLLAVFVIGLIVSFSLAMSWMVTTTGTCITLAVALILGIVAGYLIRRHISIMFVVLGVVAGFFSGGLVYALIFAVSGWKAVWGYWTISIVMAVIGFVAACKLGSVVVLLATSFTGSYLFMRAWTLFFPGYYPNETELMSEDFELETSAVFWVFVAIFGLGLIFSLFFQSRYSKKHEELDDYDRA